MTRRVWLLDYPRLDKSHVRQIPPSAKPCRKIQNGVLIIRARYGLHPVDTIQILTTLGKNCTIQVESQSETLGLVYKAFCLLRECPWTKVECPIQNACLTRPCPLKYFFYRCINIAFVSYSLISDIDECAQGDPCNIVANSECKNTDGSYNCQCKDGFVMNGRNCEGTK